jgi:hypothetical protein
MGVRFAMPVLGNTLAQAHLNVAEAHAILETTQATNSHRRQSLSAHSSGLPRYTRHTR